MSTFLQLLGTIARLTLASEETFALMIGTPTNTTTGYVEDARTAIFARFRYIELDGYMTAFFVHLQDRAKGVV